MDKVGGVEILYDGETFVEQPIQKSACCRNFNGVRQIRPFNLHSSSFLLIRELSSYYFHEKLSLRLGKTAVSNILSYQTTLVTKPTDLVILGVPFAANGSDAAMSTVADMTAISSTKQMHVYHDGEDNSAVTNAINQAMCSNGSPVTHECRAQDVVADLVIVLQSNPQLTGTEFKTV